MAVTGGSDLLGSGGSGSNGSFPQTSSGSGASDLATQVAGMTPGEFAQKYQLNSTEMGLFLGTAGQQGVNQNGLAVQNAQDYAAFVSLSPAERSSIEEAMTTAGVLTSSKSNLSGTLDSTSEAAFRTLITQANQQGQDALTYLNGLSGTGPAAQITLAGQEAAQQKAAGEAVLTTPQTVHATLTPDATIEAIATTAFSQATGQAPSQDQINNIIASIHAQENSDAAGNVQSQRAAAQQEVTNANNEMASLKNLGQDGVDQFLSLYQQAISGGGAPGAGTSQGPVTGSIPGATQSLLQPGTPLPPGTNAGVNANGTEMLSSATPTLQTTTTQQPNRYGVLGALKTDLNPLTLLHPSGLQLPAPGQQAPGTHPVTTTTPTGGKGMGTAPNLPPGLAGASQFHGGTYALTQTDWQEAQKLYPAANKYATPGEAPQAVQQGAAAQLAMNLYSQNDGDWSKVAVAMAGGDPKKTAAGTKTPTQQFAEGVASSMDTSLKNIQNQANNGQINVYDTVSPDISATGIQDEINQAAKESDPLGYYASQMSDMEQLVSQMLYGAPIGEYKQPGALGGPVPTPGSPQAATAGTPTMAGTVA